MSDMNIERQIEVVLNHVLKNYCFNFETFKNKKKIKWNHVDENNIYKLNKTLLTRYPFTLLWDHTSAGEKNETFLIRVLKNHKTNDDT